MSSVSTLFLGFDPNGRAHLIGALEERPHGALGREGARARVMLLSGLSRVADDDFRGRRINLRTLLAPDPAPAADRSAVDLLGDLGSHLAELPELGAPGRAQDFRIPLNVRFVGPVAPELSPLIPAPGGGFFELDIAQVRLPRAARGGLLCTFSELGGPWLTAMDDPEPQVAGTFALLGEAGIAGLRPAKNSFLQAWVQRSIEEGGCGLDAAQADALVRELRTQLAGLLGNDRGAPAGAGPADAPPDASQGSAARVSRSRSREGWDWLFEYRTGERTSNLTFPAARVTDSALARLQRAGATPLVPWWLLLFEQDANGGTQLSEVFSARAYLARHPELWSNSAGAPLIASPPQDGVVDDEARDA